MKIMFSRLRIIENLREMLPKFQAVMDRLIEKPFFRYSIITARASSTCNRRNSINQIENVKRDKLLLVNS